MKGFFLLIIVLFQAQAFSQSIFDAVRSGDVSAVNNMIQLNPDTVNSLNESGHSPLILAAYNNQPLIAQKLIEHGADVNFTFSQGAAIHGAAFKGYLNVVSLLVNNGAVLDEPDQNKTTPLIYATLFGHTDVAKFLFERGADPNYEDATGSSAQKYAESLKNEELLTLFKSKQE